MTTVWCTLRCCSCLGLARPSSSSSSQSSSSLSRFWRCSRYRLSVLAKSGKLQQALINIYSTLTSCSYFNNNTELATETSNNRNLKKLILTRSLEMTAGQSLVIRAYEFRLVIRYSYEMRIDSSVTLIRWKQCSNMHLLKRLCLYNVQTMNISITYPIYLKSLIAKCALTPIPELNSSVILYLTRLLGIKFLFASKKTS